MWVCWSCLRLAQVTNCYHWWEPIAESRVFVFARSCSGWFKLLTVKGLEQSVCHLEMMELQERQLLQNPCLYCNAFNGIFVKGNIRGKWYTTRKTKSYAPPSRSRGSKHQSHKCVLYNTPLPHPQTSHVILKPYPVQSTSSSHYLCA